MNVGACSHLETIGGVIIIAKNYISRARQAVVGAATKSVQDLAVMTAAGGESKPYRGLAV